MAQSPPSAADVRIVLPVAPPVDGQIWLTGDPLIWDQLRGRVVIVVFWSFGCEASLLRVRQVESIVEAAGGGTVAIAVHTPRFPFEESLEAVRSAVTQQQISIPVVHDPEYLSWNRYNPEGWPATVVVDARGRVLGSQWGTGDIDLVKDSVALGLRDPAQKAGKEPASVSSSTPLPLPDTDLAYPASIALRANGELVVADSANDRLLIFELSSDYRSAVAVAEIDGFNHPNCIVTDGAEGIYVAERAVGTVSYLDLEAKRRQVLAADLVAPTGLVVDADGSLVVADGGAEKLYRFIIDGPTRVTMGLIAGSGQTGGRDGSAADAELAQPTGMARTEVGLVFCDSASSNLRLLTDRGKVATITGNGLFDWGLVDGPAHKAMMQRPSDLAVLDDGSLIIVDTGNNRLRRLANRRIRTLGLAGLNRPASVCRLPEGHLAVADTGNNRLIIVASDLQTAWPLSLCGVLPPPGRDPVSAGAQAISSPGP
ncbi:MAG: redoxin domain-containing protein [Actinomycetia bacterium]|nr:redoxin domain-containing protein [Actinomycetes bacterium]